MAHPWPSPRTVLGARIGIGRDGPRSRPAIRRQASSPHDVCCWRELSASLDTRIQRRTRSRRGPPARHMSGGGTHQRAELVLDHGRVWRHHCGHGQRRSRIPRKPNVRRVQQSAWAGATQRSALAGNAPGRRARAYRMCRWNTSLLKHHWGVAVDRVIASVAQGGCARSTLLVAGSP